jgi:hypothetical protein
VPCLVRSTESLEVRWNSLPPAKSVVYSATVPFPTFHMPRGGVPHPCLPRLVTLLCTPISDSEALCLLPPLSLTHTMCRRTTSTKLRWVASSTCGPYP